MNKFSVKQTEGHPFLLRIVALRDIPRHGVKAGDLGGLVEDPANLSQADDAWVGVNAAVTGDAKVGGNALVCGDAWVGYRAHVTGDAKVDGNAMVWGRAVVRGKAHVRDSAEVCDRAVVDGHAIVCGNAFVGGRARAGGWDVVGPDARVLRG